MIRPFTDADLAAVYAIQGKCPEAAQWKEADYLGLAIDDGGLILLAEIAGANPPKVVGFAAFFRLGEEAELRNLAVDPGHQREGIGRALLTAGFNAIQQRGVRNAFLEVRASNQPALALYGSLGFSRLYARRNYYQDPEEDGLVMACSLSRTT